MLEKRALGTSSPLTQFEFEIEEVLHFQMSFSELVRNKFSKTGVTRSWQPLSLEYFVYFEHVVQSLLGASSCAIILY